MNISENIALLQELLLCGSTVFTWKYDADMRVLSSNCPQEGLLDEAFDLFGGKKKVMEEKDHPEPMIFSVPVGLTWGITAERDGESVQGYYVIGPVFSSDVTLNDLRAAVREYRQVSSVTRLWGFELIEILQTLPVLQYPLMVQHTLELYYCVTGERIRGSELNYCAVTKTGDENVPERDRHLAWQAEQHLLSMVREGDLSYREAMQRAANVSGGVPLHTGDPVRAAKTSVVVFASLCTRSAIEGGLSPELAYSLGDMYIQSVENCTTVSEVASYSYTMYADFVERVHRAKEDPSVPEPVREICDYIDLHAEEPLNAAMLAERAGYSDQYFRRLFLQTTGKTLADHIRDARIRHAKGMLLSGAYSVNEISEKLQFCSRAHFSEVFKKAVGVTPAKYRNHFNSKKQGE